MTQPPQITAVLARVTPFGVAFWDEVTQSTSADGLVVSAYARGRPNRRHSLHPNRAGVFTLQGIWPEVEFGRGDAAYWNAPPPQRTWVIAVEDPAGRFVPFSFEVDLPQRGRFQWACGSPAEAAQAVPLFSAPTRALPGSLGVLRADLRDASRFDPATQTYAAAGGALVEAWHAGVRLGRGLANAQGSVAVPLQYPKPPDDLFASPLASPPGQRIALSAVSWAVELRAYYSPPAAHSPPAPLPPAPDLCALLGQGPVTLLAALSPPEPLAELELVFGVEAVARTRDPSTTDERFLPELLLMP